MGLTWTDFDELRRRRKALGRPFILAHRGAMRLEPENTLRSFATALDQGADLLETDLHFSADDEIVLMHDPTVDRTTDGTGTVGKMTMAQIKALRTRSPIDDSLTDQSVPTLRELIDATHREIPLALELKDPLFLQPDYGQSLVDLLTDTGMMNRVAIISFQWEHVTAVKAVDAVHPHRPDHHEQADPTPGRGDGRPHLAPDLRQSPLHLDGPSPPGFRRSPGPGPGTPLLALSTHGHRCVVGQ